MAIETMLGESRAQQIESLVEQLLQQVADTPTPLLYREPGPGQWSVMKILAHVAELLPYWARQARDVATRGGDGQPFGRTHDDAERIAAVEEHAAATLEQATLMIRSALAEATAMLRAIPAGWTRTALHARRGEMTVAQIVDQFLVQHLEEHEQQLEGVLRAGLQLQPLSPEVLAYGLTTPSDPQVSPDGTRVIYTLHRVDPQSKRIQSQIWLCGIDGAEPRPLTPGGQHASGARWSPDGTRIAFTAAAGDGFAISVLSVDGQDGPQEITRHAQQIEDLAWSPDATQIAYTTRYDPENPDERPPKAGAAPRVQVTRRLDYKQDGRGFAGDSRLQVFVVALAGRTRRRLTTTPVDHFAPQWSPDGRRLSLHGPAGPGSGAQLLVIDLESGETKPVSPHGCQVQQWAWSPDGKRILYAGDPDRTFQPQFYLYDLAGGETRRITAALQSLPATSLGGAPSQPVWISDHQAVFAATRAAGSRLELLDLDSGRVELIEAWQARHSGLSADRAGRSFVQARTSFDAAGEICVYDRQTGRTQVITGWNAGVLRRHPPAQWQRFDVQNEGFSIEAWLLLPPDFDPSKRYPLVLDVHGGPTGNYGYGFMAHQQCLASHGFLVLYANPRGSSSYGGDFARQVFQDWGGGDYRDLMAVLDAVLERPYADAERTGIFGFSYGGYLTAWSISQSDRFKAAVCGEPFFDLVSSYGTSMNGPRGIHEHAGGPPHERRDWYAAHSPSTFAHRTRTPALIVQGEADAICPIGQAEQMFVALKQAGCEVELACYPGGSHMFFALGLPEHRADFLTRTLAWFEDHLGGPI